MAWNLSLCIWAEVPDDWAAAPRSFSPFTRCMMSASASFPNENMEQMIGSPHTNSNPCPVTSDAAGDNGGQGCTAMPRIPLTTPEKEPFKGATSGALASNATMLYTGSWPGQL